MPAGSSTLKYTVNKRTFTHVQMIVSLGKYSHFRMLKRDENGKRTTEWMPAANRVSRGFISVIFDENSYVLILYNSHYNRALFRMFALK